MGKGPAWSAAEDSMLQANMFLSNAVLADKLGRSPSAIRNRKKYFNKSPDKRVSWWTDQDRQFILDTLGWPLQAVIEATGRSESSIQNARIRVKRANGIEIRPVSHLIPRQDMWERPPGVYVEIIGRMLMEYPDAMDAWMHAHGYVSFEIKFEDSLGWVTITCVKEK